MNKNVYKIKMFERKWCFIENPPFSRNFDDGRTGDVIKKIVMSACSLYGGLPIVVSFIIISTSSQKL